MTELKLMEIWREVYPDSNRNYPGKFFKAICEQFGPQSLTEKVKYKEKYQWRVSDVLDDGHNGILTCWNEPDSYGLHADNRIVIGSASPLTREQAQKICDVHNHEINDVRP